MASNTICKTCGAPFEAGDRFCSFCGASASGEKQPTEHPSDADVTPAEEPPQSEPADAPSFWSFGSLLAPFVACMPFVIVIIVVLSGLVAFVVMMIALMVGIAVDQSSSPQDVNPPPASTTVE